jgi:hypothetical protein
VDIRRIQALQGFQPACNWFGEDIPDLGFVQLEVRDLPAVTLAMEANYLRTGMAVATAGFPMGTIAILLHNKITQLMPLLRRGIISSVFSISGSAAARVHNRYYDPGRG